MRIKLLSQLIGLNLLGWVLILVIILFPTNVLRIILGIPFLLFFPGYTMMAALFAKKEGMSGFERLALSFGLSIIVVPLIGLILNYTPWGISLIPVVLSLFALTLIFATVALSRERHSKTNS